MLLILYLSHILHIFIYVFLNCLFSLFVIIVLMVLLVRLILMLFQLFYLNFDLLIHTLFTVSKHRHHSPLLPLNVCLYNFIHLSHKTVFKSSCCLCQNSCSIVLFNLVNNAAINNYYK